MHKKHEVKCATRDPTFSSTAAKKKGQMLIQTFTYNVIFEFIVTEWDIDLIIEPIECALIIFFIILINYLFLTSLFSFISSIFSPKTFGNDGNAFCTP